MAVLYDYCHFTLGLKMNLSDYLGDDIQAYTHELIRLRNLWDPYRRTKF